jgi:hypothetical protein
MDIRLMCWAVAPQPHIKNKTFNAVNEAGGFYKHMDANTLLSEIENIRKLGEKITHVRKVFTCIIRLLARQVLRLTRKH